MHSMLVYKYVVPERIDVLEHSRIRFTQPAALNDPFETLPCYAEYNQHAIETFLSKSGMTRETASAALLRAAESAAEFLVTNIRELWSQHFTILSVTKKRNNLLMWSHYTNSHRGFVIGFDSRNPFFRPGNGKALDALRAVAYSQTRWMIPKGDMSDFSREKRMEANAKIFFTKSVDWCYEEEMRVLAHPSHADYRIPVASSYDICLHSFPPECVKEVIFGCLMTQGNRIKIDPARIPRKAESNRAQVRARHFCVIGPCLLKLATHNMAIHA